MYTFIHLFTNTATPQKEDHNLAGAVVKQQTKHKRIS